MDRRRRAAARPVGRRHPPLRAVPRQSPPSGRPHRRDRSACTTRCAGRARSSTTVRPLRRSPLYDRLRAKGAVFGAKINWERANYFLPPGAARAAADARHAGLAALRARGAARVPRGRRRVRPDVVLQIRAEGSRCAGGAAAPVRERASTLPVGRMVYTAMLNERGGFESDLTITRLRARRRSSSSPARRRRRATSTGSSAHIGDGEHAALVDVTSAYSVLSVMGPKAEALLRDAVARRSVEGRRCRSRRRGRSTSATRACARRG